jgi:hypothetical protein
MVLPPHAIRVDIASEGVSAAATATPTPFTTRPMEEMVRELSLSVASSKVVAASSSESPQVIMSFSSETLRSGRTALPHSNVAVAIPTHPSLSSASLLVCPWASASRSLIMDDRQNGGRLLLLVVELTVGMLHNSSAIVTVTVVTSAPIILLLPLQDFFLVAIPEDWKQILYFIMAYTKSINNLVQSYAIGTTTMVVTTD